MNKPEEHIIQSLLEKHALGICTPEEIAVLHEWYDAFPDKGPAFADEEEKKYWKNDIKTAVMDNIQPWKVRKINWWQIAAAAVVVVAVATFLLKPWEPEYIGVMAPKGKGVMRIELPDNSIVWLQAGSTLRYEGRHVELIDGIAGFSVVQNSDEPFTVRTVSGLNVKVLGTEFTVKALKELPDVKVYVESGAVQISDSSNANIAVLKTDQQIVYNIATHQFIQDSVHAAEEARWKTGEYTLDNAPFAELARILKDQFDTEIRYNERIMAPYRFNIRITPVSTLPQILDMLHEISGVNYTINGNHVIITGVSQ
ncbi:FecR family protein [Chitinophaga niabensis]|uniref:Ferric-dicitrate binding protein FerR, regulates iron transport through sigma-19 n=1 Tax=Chitinophaga niabensis TaxID=536979 RepID=A0A1N6D392_9BACT|nr:FecR family protein [Chitinophaga niabensis]SIN65173.1 ferric-dicitrate binding protein FerR, regulates iron transport through sigma-19 [Chitinophaga niabensis]